MVNIILKRRQDISIVFVSVLAFSSKPHSTASHIYWHALFCFHKLIFTIWLVNKYVKSIPHIQFETYLVKI